MFWVRWNRFADRPGPVPAVRVRIGPPRVPTRRHATARRRPVRSERSARTLPMGPRGAARPTAERGRHASAERAVPARFHQRRRARQPDHAAHRDVAGWDVLGRHRERERREPGPTTSVTIDGRDAAFLLRAASEEPPPPSPTPDPTPSPPAERRHERAAREPDRDARSRARRCTLGPTVITGVASDDTGVAGVRVILARRRSGRLLAWRHTRLASRARERHAPLESPGAPTTRWSVAWAPDVARLRSSSPRPHAMWRASSRWNPERRVHGRRRRTPTEPPPTEPPPIGPRRRRDDHGARRRGPRHTSVVPHIERTASGPRPDAVEVTIFDLERASLPPPDGTWGDAGVPPGGARRDDDVGDPVDDPGGGRHPRAVSGSRWSPRGARHRSPRWSQSTWSPVIGGLRGPRCAR